MEVYVLESDLGVGLQPRTLFLSEEYFNEFLEICFIQLGNPIKTLFRVESRNQSYIFFLFIKLESNYQSPSELNKLQGDPRLSLLHFLS